MSRRDFVIGSSRRRLERKGVRFRPRLVDAEGRTVRFADHHLLEDVGVVVWGTGYRSDYAWIQIPGVVREGHVVHRRGVTEVPGLYFLGLSWQHTRGSALLGMLYSFDDAGAAERHHTQYFEMFGNRGIYHEGWSALTKHRTPWEYSVGTGTVAFDDDVWELYDGSKDWTQAHDLAKQVPDKLHELQRLFLIQAARFNVLPLDDRVAERLIPDVAGRPTLIRAKSQLLFPGMGGLNENCVVNLKNKSHSITAELVVPEDGANGVLINQGGRTGGWALYVAEGRLAYVYNFVGVQLFRSLPTSRCPRVSTRCAWSSPTTAAA